MNYSKKYIDKYDKFRLGLFLLVICFLSSQVSFLSPLLNYAIDQNQYAENCIQKTFKINICHGHCQRNLAILNELSGVFKNQIGVAHSNEWNELIILNSALQIYIDSPKRFYPELFFAVQDVSLPVPIQPRISLVFS